MPFQYSNIGLINLNPNTETFEFVPVDNPFLMSKQLIVDIPGSFIPEKFFFRNIDVTGSKSLHQNDRKILIQQPRFTLIFILHNFTFYKYT